MTPSLRLSAEQERRLLDATGAQSLTLGDRLQSLWSGYGEIRRVTLQGARCERAILKYVLPPEHGGGRAKSPETRSHARKLRSYDVELEFYRRFAVRCDETCRVPACQHASRSAGGWLFLLEDLDVAGFSGRRERLRPSELGPAMQWLAQFHATFLGARPEGLWKVGTYWHLGTRQDEFAAMAPSVLKTAAQRLDVRLLEARHQTLVHGDAKLENFCFSERGSEVAALDFQYVGRGVGVRDLAYFLGSALSPAELEAQGDRLLEDYLAALGHALVRRGLEANSVVEEWRELYCVAWADFHRFLLGWAPRHAHEDRYTSRMVRRALAGS